MPRRFWRGMLRKWFCTGLLCEGRIATKNAKIHKKEGPTIGVWTRENTWKFFRVFSCFSWLSTLGCGRSPRWVFRVFRGHHFTLKRSDRGSSWMFFAILKAGSSCVRVFRSALRMAGALCKPFLRDASKLKWGDSSILGSIRRCSMNE